MTFLGNIINKFCAMLLIIALTVSNFLFVGEAAVSYAVETIKTNNQSGKINLKTFALSVKPFALLKDKWLTYFYSLKDIRHSENT